MPEWNAKRIATLRKMYAADETAARIAEVTGMSRGAVSGKLFRLGLCTPHDEQWGQGKANKLQSHRQRELANQKRRVRHQADAAELREHFAAVEIVDLPPDQSAVAVPFAKLNGNTCRWPLGDPRDLDAMLFCGDESCEDRPYCARHCRIAYRPRYQQAAE